MLFYIRVSKCAEPGLRQDKLKPTLKYKLESLLKWGFMSVLLIWMSYGHPNAKASSKISFESFVAVCIINLCFHLFV